MDYRQAAVITIGGIPSNRGVQVAPPIAWHIPAVLFHEESGSSIESGRYHTETGEVKGILEIDRGSETYINGTAGRIGTSFEADSGTWKSDWKNPWENVYGIQFPDTTSTASGVVTTTYSFSNLPSCEVQLYRSFPGTSSTSDDYTADNCYTELIFHQGHRNQWKLRIAYDEPVTLQYSDDTGATWQKSSQRSDTPNLQEFLSGRKMLHIRIRFYVDRKRGVVTVETNAGAAKLQHAIGKDLAPLMDDGGKFQVRHKNGSLCVNYFPMTPKTISVKKKARNFGRNLPNSGNARVVLNSLSQPPDGQTNDYSISTDGRSIGFTATAESANDDPPILADATLVLPAMWSRSVDGVPDVTNANFGAIAVREVETWDQVSRQYHTSATIVANNRNAAFNSYIGNYFVNIVATNGQSWAQRFSGIARNPSFMRSDPVRNITLSVSDWSHVLNVPIEQEVCFDGWCLYSAVRYLCELGNIHPMWLTNLPIYVPPGASLDAPYGPAGTDCPWYILARGTGLNPRYNYLPNATAWQVLSELCMDSSEVVGGFASAYMMGFAPDGQFFFNPVSYANRTPVAVYKDNDPTGMFPILEGIEWNVGMDNMRSHINLQGIDALTYELLHVHQEMNPGVRAAIGYRHGYTERSARFSDETQMTQVIAGMSVPASLPEITASFKTVFWPHIHAGMIVGVYDAHHGYLLGVIEQLVNEYDTTPDSGFSYLTVRSLANYL